jgi:transcriptional regulator with XRE-family HTH domain
MKITDSKHRLRELIDYVGISQTEFCKRAGLNKSALSNYLNGDREPRQDKIALVADAFGVSPAWLMGYDVPMEMENKTKIQFGVSEIEREIILKYRQSDEITKEMMLRVLGIEKRDIALNA